MEFALAEIDTKTKAESGVDMQVRKVDGSPLLNPEGKPVMIRLRGMDSDAYRDAQASAYEQIKQRAENKDDASTIAKSGEESAIELLVSCTIGWSGVLNKDGEPVMFTADAARALYRQYPVIRDQVDRFIGTRANFLLGSSKG